MMSVSMYVCMVGVSASMYSCMVGARGKKQ